MTQENSASIRMAVIRAGLVENIIQAPQGFELEDPEVSLVADLEGCAQIGGSYAGGAFHAPAPIVDRAQLVEAIDEAVLAIYARPMQLAKEYEEREAAALAYQAAGYSGTVPPRVQGFAQPAGKSAREAADLILGQADQLRTALGQLSDLRMRKYAVIGAASDAEALERYQATIAAIAAIGAALK